MSAHIEVIDLDPRRRVNVVRDDLTTGGTKIRALIPLLQSPRYRGYKEFIYASPAYGYAQVALAHACQSLGKQATIFVAQRKTKHPNTQLAEQMGAQIHEVPYGYLVVIKRKATDYQEQSPHNRCLLPWGLKCPQFHKLMVQSLKPVRKQLDSLPSVGMTIWGAVGSGTLFECMAEAFPKSDFQLVQVGAEYKVPKKLRNRVTGFYIAPEKFEKRAKYPPPYPSNEFYDAKLWQFVTEYAEDGDTVWNVA